MFICTLYSTLNVQFSLTFTKCIIGPWGPPINCYSTGSLSRRWSSQDVDHPPPSRAEVKERILTLWAFKACSKVTCSFTYFPHLKECSSCSGNWEWLYTLLKCPWRNAYERNGKKFRLVHTKSNTDLLLQAQLMWSHFRRTSAFFTVSCHLMTNYLQMCELQER